MVIISNIFEGTAMIDYSPFWETLKKTNENWYTLTSKHHMSHSTLHRLKHNQDISMKTVNDLCRILHCQIQDICIYVPSDEDQPLLIIYHALRIFLKPCISLYNEFLYSV